MGFPRIKVSINKNSNKNNQLLQSLFLRLFRANIMVNKYMVIFKKAVSQNPAVFSGVILVSFSQEKSSSGKVFIVPYKSVKLL